MKKISILLAVAVLLGLGLKAEALSVYGNSQAQVELGVKGNATSTEAKAGASATSSLHASTTGNSTSSAAKAKQESQATSTGELKSSSHRSAVAIYVQSLLSVANRDAGIGEEVRLVARAQNDAASSSDEAIEKVNGRGRFKQFLFGTDYKSIGKIRSEIAVTKNSISRLKNLLSLTNSASVKADLETQIKNLEESQTKLEAFVNAHEDKFSVFGWFVKLFSK